VTWDRIQRLELELAQARAALLAATSHDRCHAKLREAVRRMETLADERDLARDVAVALEAETAACPNHEYHQAVGE
jgi:hypothetical protein